MKNVAKRSNKKAPEVFTAITREQEVAILDHFKARDEKLAQFFMLLFATGLRPSEALALHKSNAAAGNLKVWYDEEQEALHICRDYPYGKSRIVPIVGYCKDFMSKTFQFPFGQEKAHREWKRASMNLPGVSSRTLYDIRKTVAYRLAAAGHSEELVANFLGHAIPSSNRRFVKPSKEETLKELETTYLRLLKGVREQLEESKTV